MNKKRSLGRGLQSLIPEMKDKAESISSGKIYKISLDKIKPREGQPRKTFDKESLLDLAESIKEYGLLNPITVSKLGDEYEIIAGERRYRASKLIGLKEIDAIIKTLEQRDIEVLSLIENVQREDLSSIEEANAYKILADSYGLTQDEIAKKMGKSRSYIANTIRLLKLNNDEKKALEAGDLTSSQARSLLAVKDEKKRAKAMDDYINKKTVVREVEKIAKNKKEKLPNLDQILFDDYEEKLMDKLGSRVKIDKAGEVYKVTIDCFSIDDIEKLYERLGNDGEI